MAQLNEKDWLSVVMEEYKSVRQEYMVANQSAQSVLSFCIAALVFLFGVGINLWDEPAPASELIFFCFAPFITLYFSFIQNQIAARAFHARQFLLEIENKVNSYFKEELKALYWDSYLRQTKPVYDDMPATQVYILLATGLLSFSVGIIHKFAASQPEQTMNLVLICVLFALFTIIYIMNLRNLSAFNKKLQ